MCLVNIIYIISKGLVPNYFKEWGYFFVNFFMSFCQYMVWFFNYQTLWLLLWWITQPPCPFNVLMHSLVSIFHNLIVLSPDTLASSPCPSKLTWLTQLPCPFNVLMHSPVSIFNNLIVLSPDTLARRPVPVKTDACNTWRHGGLAWRCPGCLIRRSLRSLLTRSGVVYRFQMIRTRFDHGCSLVTCKCFCARHRHYGR